MAQTQLTLCLELGRFLARALLVDLDQATVIDTLESPVDSIGELIPIVQGMRQRLVDEHGVPPASLEATQLRVASGAGGVLQVAVLDQDGATDAALLNGTGARCVYRHAGGLDYEQATQLAQSEPHLAVALARDPAMLTGWARRLAGLKRPIRVLLAGPPQATAEAAKLLRAHGRPVDEQPTQNTADDPQVRAEIRSWLNERFHSSATASRTLRARLDDVPFASMVTVSTPQARAAGLAMCSFAQTVAMVDSGPSWCQVTSPDPSSGAAVTTVEGDLGVGDAGRPLVRAAQDEGLVDGPFHAVQVGGEDLIRDFEEPTEVSRPHTQAALTALGVRVAMRRHARPPRDGGAGGDLSQITRLIGAGAVLRHTDDDVRRLILEPLTIDHGGGWSVPENVHLGVDEAGVLFAAGLIAPSHPEVATALADRACERLLPE